VIAERLKTDACLYDFVVFSVGINDVWRRFQGRLDEAVDIEEYEANYRKALTAPVGSVACYREGICS
jgi:hypothetical protein